MIKIKNYLFLLVLLLFWLQCAIFKNANSGSFKDNRDGQTYQWIKLKDGKKWMTQNLNYQIVNSWCYEDEHSNCAKYGRLYTWSAALKACPEGWKLPTDDDWWELASYYEKADNYYKNGQEINFGEDAGKSAYKALIIGGDSRVSTMLGGTRFSAGRFYSIGSFGFYWTSTELSNPYTNGWAYFFAGNKKKLIRTFEGEGTGLSCRCLQD